MRKLHVVVLTLVVAFSFGAVVASTAMAEEATVLCVPWLNGLWMLRTNATTCAEELAASDGNWELTEMLLAFWLVGGEPVLSELLVLAEGEIRVKNISNSAEIDCSFHAEGSIWPESLLEITEVLDLLGTTVGKLPAGPGILCTSLTICETGDARAFPENLPWHFELELVGAGGLYFLLITLNAVLYEFTCLVLGIEITESCEAPVESAAEQLNVAAGVEAMGVLLPLANCNGVSEVGENEGLAGNILLSEGVVSVSSE